MSHKLSVSVFTSAAKPIPSQLASWDASRQATWPASTATLIAGKRDAILIDALITVNEAELLVAWIQASGKNLTTIYITHGHADHFFGLPVLLEAFPDAVAVTKPEVVPYSDGQLDPAFVAFWESLFPGQLPAHPVAPRAMTGETLELEGHAIRPVLVGQSDTHPSTVVYIPSLQAVVGGDVAYNGIHMWLAQADGSAREGWLEALSIVEKLNPRTIVAGHQIPGAKVDEADRILATSRQYILDFDEALRTGNSVSEIVAFMQARYADLDNEYTLWAAAEAQAQSV